jgi:hypothetical protein
MTSQRAVGLIVVLGALGVSVAFWLNNGRENQVIPDSGAPVALPLIPPSPSMASAPLNSSAPPLTTASSSAAPKASEDLRREFSNLRQEVFQSMPTKADLAKLSDEDAHYTPQAMFNAAVELGKIAQAVADHPDLAPETFEFYKQCAEKELLPDSLRASCYAEFQKLLKSSGLSEALPQVPQNVIDLAAQVM